MRPAKLKVSSPAGKARVYVLEGDQYTVGRVAPNHEPDIVLAPDPQGWISRLHCILDLELGQWWVTDHARNGTLLQRDAPGSEVRPVRGRELLKHGDTLLVRRHGKPLTAFTTTSAEQQDAPYDSAARNRTVTVVITPG
ncbi:FHA domain-containing protein [Streptomyces vastus]|uniref:FHA domain-containing protein n=1 Tax=Streptomyces vastus TaxID=285451 RepID=A0ABN3RX60_9ACTN